MNDSAADLLLMLREESILALGNEDKDWMLQQLCAAYVRIHPGVSPGFLQLAPVTEPALPRKPPHKAIGT